MSIILLVFMLSCANPVDITRDDEAMYSLAQSYYDSGNYDEAVGSYETIINEYQYSDRYDNALYYCGKSYYKRAMLNVDTPTVLIDNLTNAKIKFKSLPENSSYKIKGDYWNFKASVELYFIDSSLYAIEGLQTMKNYEQSYPSFPYDDDIKRIIENVESGDYDIVKAFYQVDAYYDLENYNKCIAIIENMGETSELLKDDYVSFKFAMAYYHNKDYNVAISYYSMINETQSLYAESLYWKGISLYKQSKYDECITILTAYEDTFPDGTKIASVKSYISLAEGKL